MKKIFLISVIVIILIITSIGVFQVRKKKNQELLLSRALIINYLIAKYNLNSYLEIGLDDPYNNFVWIHAKQKTSVDPYIEDGVDGKTHENINKWLKMCTHRMTSDAFFKQNRKKFDIIFIDGLHEEKQVDKDIYNALKVLNKGGFIIVHDCIPESESAQIIPRRQAVWNGTVWKSFLKLNLLKNPNLKIYVVNTDYGCGIIQKLADVEYKIPAELNMSWKYFDRHKNSLYNIIEKQDFFSKL